VDFLWQLQKNIQRRLAALLKAVFMAAELRGGWILRVHLLVLLVIAVRSLCGVLPADVTDRNFCVISCRNWIWL
jgi:hypothetical protein